MLDALYLYDLLVGPVVTRAVEAVPLLLFVRSVLQDTLERYFMQGELSSLRRVRLLVAFLHSQLDLLEEKLAEEEVGYPKAHRVSQMGGELTGHKRGKGRGSHSVSLVFGPDTGLGRLGLCARLHCDRPGRSGSLCHACA